MVGLAPCGTPIVAITAQTIHQSSSVVRRRAASARTLAPIGSGKAASGHSKALEAFLASEYKGCSEIGGVNSCLGVITISPRRQRRLVASSRMRAEVTAGYGKGEGDLKVLFYAF